MGGKRVRHRSRRRAVLPLLALSLVAGVALAWGLGHLDRGQGAALVDQPDAASPSGPTATSAAASASSSPMTAAPVTPARRSGDQPEAPVQVRLPSGTTVPVVAVNTTADGVLDVPEDIRTAGWWRGGSRLGDPFGPTVIAAHIDSRTQGLGPYVELLSVAPDARIRVTSAHLVQHFRVISRRLVPRTSLAGVTDLFSATGPRRLTMVTCAGPYDAARGGYQNLAVVTARPLGAPSPRMHR